MSGPRVIPRRAARQPTSIARLLRQRGAHGWRVAINKSRRALFRDGRRTDSLSRRLPLDAPCRPAAPRTRPPPVPGRSAPGVPPHRPERLREPVAAGVVPVAARASATGRSQRTAVILVWLRGGLSHLETYDPKPDAPAEVRGAYGTIPTNVARPAARRAAPAAREDRRQVHAPPLDGPHRRRAPGRVAADAHRRPGPAGQAQAGLSPTG